MTIRESNAAAIARVPQGHERLGHSNIPLVKQYCGPASLIFEIGAYIGFDIPLIHEQWPDAEIHTFEPDPDPFKRLEEYVSPHIVHNQIALTNKNERVTFFQVHDSKTADQATRSEWFKTAGSLRENGPLHRGASPSLKEHPITVQGMTLDFYCNNQLKTPAFPDILLMDTQGSEYEILEGAAETLTYVKAILLEWSILEVYKGQKYLADIQELLSVYGFEMKRKVNLWGNHHGDAVFAR